LGRNGERRRWRKQRTVSSGCNLAMAREYGERSRSLSCDRKRADCVCNADFVCNANFVCNADFVYGTKKLT